MAAAHGQQAVNLLEASRARGDGPPPARPATRFEIRSTAEEKDDDDATRRIDEETRLQELGGAYLALARQHLNMKLPGAAARCLQRGLSSVRSGLGETHRVVRSLEAQHVQAGRLLQEQTSRYGGSVGPKGAPGRVDGSHAEAHGHPSRGGLRHAGSRARQERLLASLDAQRGLYRDLGTDPADADPADAGATDAGARRRARTSKLGRARGTRGGARGPASRAGGTPRRNADGGSGSESPDPAEAPGSHPRMRTTRADMLRAKTGYTVAGAGFEATAAAPTLRDPAPRVDTAHERFLESERLFRRPELDGSRGGRRGSAPRAARPRLAGRAYAAQVSARQKKLMRRSAQRPSQPSFSAGLRRGRRAAGREAGGTRRAPRQPSAPRRQTGRRGRSATDCLPG